MTAEDRSKMVRAELLIRGGTFFGMKDGSSPKPASVAISGGRILSILPPDTDAEADFVFDATDLYVTPGFVDSHIHDEYYADPDTVQQALIRQGVTTAVAGHCGSGPNFFKSRAERTKPWLHLSYMVGNCMLREEIGHKDRYTPATPEEVEKMKALLRESLAGGAMGLSLGLEYAPGATYDEIKALAGVVAAFDDRLITVHIRYDDDRCVRAVEEVIRLARETGVRLQVSHLGSMTMYNTQTCMDVIDAAMKEGLDVCFDCYPYDAFCAKAGSAVYDDGFVERWRGKGPEALEAVSGQFKGQRLTFETLAKMRTEEPMDLIVAHVMDKEEVENCLAHPKCIVASDALYTGGGAHPRIAGTFPRALRILRERGYTWQDALAKMTTMPADRIRLENAGRLAKGSIADVIVFNPETFVDNATFQEPFAPPTGLELVVVGGKVTLRDGKFSPEPVGDFYERK
ncbi:amidohydrolase family protein [Synergistaceae bacterium OttesenSCG-928-I11]|nr:amidohydrolase family protein [Synergistaceae bacterium OttesenSCG-928-I11]